MATNYGNVGLLVAKAISDAFYELLSKHHLYQSVELALTPINDYIRDDAERAVAAQLTSLTHRPSGDVRARSLAENNAILKNVLGTTWEVAPADGLYSEPERPRQPNTIYFGLPTIHTVCPNPQCDREWPFNPVPLSRPTRIIDNGPIVQDLRNSVQVFACAYQCQSCKTEPLAFLVRRHGTKLTFVGRSRIETVTAPAVFPKPLRQFYSDAVIAFNSGHTLPALFLLRVLIEQFWRTLEKRGVLVIEETNARLHVDQLATAYSAILPSDFRDRFPSLPKLYDDLSGRLHAANPDNDLFEQAQRDLTRHFEARRLHEIDAADEALAAANAPSTDDRGSP